jgi:N-acetylmuramoyl-L-alanine amidase
MTHCCSRFGPAVAAFALVLAATAVHAERVVEQVRYYPHDGFTRIVLDVSAPCAYKVAGHSNPERIAINLAGSRAGRSLRNITVGSGGVDRVRVNRLTWGTQVVIDLAAAAAWKDFALARTDGKPDRIVIDVSQGGVTPPSAEAATRQRRAAESGLFVVAIDAGHGGRDHGTTGRYGLVEKEYTLDLAKRIANEVDSYPGFKAVLTRSTDVYLTLLRRVEIAEAKGADIFVSIHLNSAPNRSARGAEVFFVSPAGAERIANQMLANPDRAAHELGIRGAASSDVLQMLVDVNQQAVLTRSEGLAESILVALSKPGLLATRSVKQKSFAVLRNISMPSVLIEAGFISNTADANLIRSVEGRGRIARSIGAGIRSYLGANPPPREEGESAVVHRVRAGDTLWRISREYGSSVASIRRVNQLGASSVLRVGQELLIYNR